MKRQYKAILVDHENNETCINVESFPLAMMVVNEQIKAHRTNIQSARVECWWYETHYKRHIGKVLWEQRIISKVGDDEDESDHNV